MNLTESEISALSALEQGIPAIPRPYEELARTAGMAEKEFIEILKNLVSRGIVRRLGARINHYNAGFMHNAMVVFCVSEEDADEAAESLSASPSVSHCYLRPGFPGFKYNLYAMVHAGSSQDLEKSISDLAGECGINDFIILRSLREFKKSPPVICKDKD
ncbi:MAG: Lrp/AsnC family transcriptional regulator [Chloroflexi bacterium]|nr:Lrp/AsnC family transcriptional regulator [Chloroflexota bacterium]